MSSFFFIVRNTQQFHQKNPKTFSKSRARIISLLYVNEPNTLKDNAL